MNKATGRMLVATAVLLILAAGASWAYTLKGDVPTWWSSPKSGSTNLRAEWTSWSNGWIDEFGAVPDAWDIDFEPLGPLPDPTKPDQSWEWGGIAGLPERVVANNGIWIKGGKTDQDFYLALGNRNLREYKEWYVEFELDRVPTPLANWDPKRFEFDAQGGYDGGTSLVDFQTLGSGWKQLTDDSGKDYLVWWGRFYISPQTDLDKFEWQFTTNSLTPIDGFYVRRVTTGTNCTPEPVSMVLLALGLPLGLLARKRRRE
jgi:hypothetical protein